MHVHPVAKLTPVLNDGQDTAVQVYVTAEMSPKPQDCVTTCETGANPALQAGKAGVVLVVFVQTPPALVPAADDDALKQFPLMSANMPRPEQTANFHILE